MQPPAASSPNSTVEAMSSPTVPSAAPTDDVVRVEKNRAAAATPSIEITT